MGSKMASGFPGAILVRSALESNEGDAESRLLGYIYIR